MSDPALNIAEVLWEERMALARPTPSTASHGPGETPAPDPDKDISDPKQKTAVEKGASVEVAEIKVAERTKDRPNDIAEIDRCLNADNNWALCLSGGGIRSAAFALGVIQRFAAQRIAPKCGTDQPGSALQQFEYLSTVSGGGYIGSWLSAWLFQERRKRQASGANTGGANDVVADLNGRTKDYAEIEPISNLRRDSHYLAPSFSAISPDLWSDIAAVVRNLCLNWILLVPPMILAVLITKALSYGFIDALAIEKQSAWLALIMIAATICFVAALSFSAANRPARGLINASQAQFLICDMAIFLIGAALLIFVLASPKGKGTLTDVICDDVGLFCRDDSTSAVLFRGALLGLAIYLVSWFAAWLWGTAFGPRPQRQLELAAWHGWVDLVAWCVAGAAFGALIAAGYLLVLQLTPSDPKQFDAKQLAALVVVCGLPWIVSARVIADVIFIAFAKFIPVRVSQQRSNDRHRITIAAGADAGLEYQARSGGIFMLAQLGWLIWFGLVLGAPMVAHWIVHFTGAWLAAAGGISGAFISGAFSVIVGFSSKTAAIAQEATRLRQYLGLNTLAAIAAAIFAAILVAGLSIVIDWAFTFDPSKAEHPPWPLALIAGAVLAILIVAASLVIGINQYSLHSIYRNRLVRAFLGASRDEDERDRSKNRFTDFDSLDSPLLHHLWSDDVNPRGDDWRPLHVINAAVNLVSSKNLAWQERMAAPFTFSPLHCGSGSSIFSNGAYRRTHPASDQSKPYGGRLGLTLGTAMAISGAAVSPNMGYNTSPGVAFLMALFNVRLGWWLANPRSENSYYWLTSPGFALRPYFMEMFGLTSETERWVYLSDGGHFENLGIYEMVRRRCRVIVVSDAGCDPDYAFDDLGNALRKIWIDLGVRVEVGGLDRLKKRFKERPTPATHEPYWAVGRIRYNAADGGGEDGWLLYFKSGLHGTEPMDVLSYAMSHPTFPHETTSNQFFTESQFESYRMLGYEIVSRALESGGCAPLGPAVPAGGAVPAQTPTAGLTLDVVIKHLEAQLHARAPGHGFAH